MALLTLQTWGVLPLQTGGVVKGFETAMETFHNAMVGVPLLRALIILVVGLFVAIVMSRYLQKILGRIGVDKLFAETILADIAAESGKTLSTLLSDVFRWFVYLLTFILVLTTLGIPGVEGEALLISLREYLPNVVVAILILVLGVVLIDLISAAIRGTARVADVKNPQIVATAVKYPLYALLIIVVLGQLRVNETLLLIIAGSGFFAVALAVGLGIGLGLRDVGQSMLFGIYEIFGGAIEKDDMIEVRGYRGRIITVGLLNTSIETEDGNRIVLPNSVLATEEIKILKNKGETRK